MAGTDVAKRRKAFRGDTGWNDVTPHGNSDRLRGCGKCLGGDSLSPRQSLAQPSLDLTKGVNESKTTAQAQGNENCLEGQVIGHD